MMVFNPQLHGSILVVGANSGLKAAREDARARSSRHHMQEAV